MKRDRRGFTLVELVIAMTVSSLVIGGMAYFVMKVNITSQLAQNRGNMYTTLTDYIDKVNSLKNRYTSGSVLVDANPGYDVLLFTNTGQTAGVMLGVVDNISTSPNYLRLDQPENFSKYRDRTLAIQELTQSQLASVLSSPSAAYSIAFQKDKLYPSLKPETFAITPYNSGSLFEVLLSLYDGYLPGYLGVEKLTLPADQLETTSVNLVF